MVGRTLERGLIMQLEVEREISNKFYKCICECIDLMHPQSIDGLLVYEAKIIDKILQVSDLVEKLFEEKPVSMSKTEKHPQGVIKKGVCVHER